MENCKTCKYALFDALWGQYKCAVKRIYLYGDLSTHVCGNYKEGKPAESKKNTEYHEKHED